MFEQIVPFLWKVLWVVGGFVGGFFLTLGGAVAVDKLVVKGTSPQWMHKVARWIGGVLVSLVVAFFVFKGGAGDGPGGGGTGTAVGTGSSTATSTATPVISPTATAATSSTKVSTDALFVTIFAGGDVEAGTKNYYQLDGRDPKVDLKGLTDEAKRRKADGSNFLVYDFAATAGPEVAGHASLQDNKASLPLTVISKDDYRKLKQAK